MWSKIAFLRWPFALVHLISLYVSRFFFQRGIWKSVEFDMPVISLHSFHHDGVSINCVRWLKKEIDLLTNHSSSVLLTRYDFHRNGFRHEKESNFFNLIPACDQPGYFQYRHRLLGISDVAASSLLSNLVILPQDKLLTEVRPCLKVLFLDNEAAVLKEQLWPVGNKKFPNSWIEGVDMIIVKVTSKNAMSTLGSWLSTEVPVFFVEVGDEQNNLSPIYKADHSGIFIDDRDNFGRSIKKVINQFEFI